jgi:hypothetical protein
MVVVVVVAVEIGSGQQHQKLGKYSVGSRKVLV